MYLTEWTQEPDGSYYECFGHLRQGLNPMFTLRAVKVIDGNYEAIVRDYKTGKLLSSRNPGVNKGFELDVAKNIAIELCQILLMFEGTEECIIVKRYICPHKSISGKHCTYCKIPDMIRINMV